MLCKCCKCGQHFFPEQVPARCPECKGREDLRDRLGIALAFFLVGISAGWVIAYFVT